MKVPPAQKIRDLTESRLPCSQAWKDPSSDEWVSHAPIDCHVAGDGGPHGSEDLGLRGTVRSSEGGVPGFSQMSRYGPFMKP